MAPIPDPMPSETAMRPSASDSPNRRVNNEPKPAEIWAVGPSRPPEPPEPIVMALDTIFTATARARIDRGSLCTASIAASVPCPCASGASLATMNADTSAPPKVISGIAHGRVKPREPDPPPSVTAFGAS